MEGFVSYSCRLTVFKGPLVLLNVKAKKGGYQETINFIVVPVSAAIII